MLLAEVMSEKEYLKDSIKSLIVAMCQILASEDKPKNALTKNLQRLEDLYKKYQQFEITSRRAMFQVKIQLNDMELSLSEAVGLKNAMQDKLSNYENLINWARDAVEIEPISDKIEELRKDIKTLSTAIDRAIWSTEI